MMFPWHRGRGASGQARGVARRLGSWRRRRYAAAVRTPSETPFFVTLEGIDGSGKSTQARLLADALRARGRDVLLTREPGGSPGAEAIRDLVLAGEPGRWSPVTEALLFTAARRDHLERAVEPALAAGRTVVCDRYADSTRVYQGASGRGDRRALVDRLHALCVEREPDLTLVIDLDPAAALARARDPGRFEAMGAAFQARLREGFLALAHEFPRRCRVIDGAGAPEAVAARVLAAFDAA